MKTKRLFCLLSICFLITQSLQAQLTKAFEIEGQYYNPWYIQAFNDDRLIIFDGKNKKQALQLRSIPNGEILNAHRLGRGPGELSGVGPKIINRTADRISVWDANAKNMLLYDGKLNYRSAVLINKPVMNVAFSGTGMAYATSSLPEEPFLKLFKTTENGLSSKPIQTYTTKNHPELAPLAENFMLRQGPFLTDGENLYMGFSYSTIILKVTPTSISLFDEAPNPIPLPEYEFAKNRGGNKIYVAPDVSSFAQGTLGMDLDDNFLYALYSGKKLEGTEDQLKKWQQEGTLAERFEDLNYSTKILVYSKQSGEYLRTLTLPQRARKIAISESYIFALSLDREGLPIIIAYHKETEN